MATSGFGPRMSRAVTASVVSHATFPAPIQVQRSCQIGPLHKPVTRPPAPQSRRGAATAPRRGNPLLGQVCSMNQQPAEAPAEKPQPNQPRRRVAPLSSAANGTYLCPTSPRTPEGPDSNRSTPTFGGLAGIEESPQHEDSDVPKEAIEVTTPLTKCAQNGNSEKAVIFLQRWWKDYRRSQQELFESLVVEIMELRKEAAKEVQRAWRDFKRRRALAAAAR
mmetsp:Transcript_68022/g.150833  ORF Transcript_68022/g.150833 Transcript_68022/m.150833 type:complete len:221 (+) Transcript_68022:131-793(+)